MNREPDLDALAEAIEHARQERQHSWPVRALSWLVRRHPVPVVCGVASVTGVIGLDMAGVDPGTVLMVMFYATPVLAAGVAMFVVHAWRQNTGLTYDPPASDLDVAEPGQVGQASQPGQPQDLANPLATGLAKPSPPATITVTVLPLPKAALPRAVGQGHDTHYPPLKPVEIREEDIDA